MTPVEVTLAGYDGWGLFYIWAAGIAALALAIGLALGRKAVSTSEWVNLWWILRMLCFGVIILGPAIAFGVFLEISRAHDLQQRAEALAKVGVTHVQFTGEARGVRNHFIGSADEKYIVGSFVQIEGEQWVILGAAQ